MTWKLSILAGVCAAIAGLLGSPGAAAVLFLAAGGLAITAYRWRRS